ncbi:glycoside hydrolase family 32 protein [Cystobasidium minutum MCA 4210]|uniref:glycoside hydrolase family 32 protein n=1 Tax=Cystobasidium minutum MCA 4210 TaxID=1397322 RepID=UPI0034CEA3AF|eukprot:jgi/Rhomi1/147972/e_gw1.10.13.1
MCVHSFQTTHSWQNDPIGPVYNEQTSLYHLYCQWNPHGTEWGNMSWFSAASKDLVTWFPYGSQPSLKPDKPYDREGVFTGCVLPRGPRGEKDQMTAIYTSVTSPTIHWTLPYQRGSEGVSIATSRDGGITWQKDAGNPIIEEPPSDLQVTGFRDPYISTLPSLDRLLGRNAGEYVYATLSGGTVDKTPTPFLYSVPSNNLRQWESLGQLMDIGLDYEPSAKWCGEGGRNFECCSLFEMHSIPTLVTSTEGGRRRWSMWIQGKMTLQDGQPRLEYGKSGVMDWGCFYAASTSEHPIDGRRLVMGWIPEDDLTVTQRRDQGWAGMASLARELVSLEYSDVVKALATPISEIGSLTCEREGPGTYTVKTVGIRPVKELLKLRETAKARQIADCSLRSSARSLRLPLQSKTWELEFEADILESCSALNVIIQHSAREFTLITFDVSNEKITVDRQYSSLLPDVKKAQESGSHTLFSFKSDKDGSIRQESLALRMSFDVSVLEIYANDRFALSTRVYPSSSGPASLCICAETEEGCSGAGSEIAMLSSVGLWER